MMGEAIEQSGGHLGVVPRGTHELEAVYDIAATVIALLGEATMQVSQLLKLDRGAVVKLDCVSARHRDPQSAFKSDPVGSMIWSF